MEASGEASAGSALVAHLEPPELLSALEEAGGRHLLDGALDELLEQLVRQPPSGLLPELDEFPGDHVGHPLAVQAEDLAVGLTEVPVLLGGPQIEPRLVQV
ncbi:MAG: hypothetical protein CO030_04770 [Candidatus Magasanikbacteria bacterium CG_4_9_14_0_2_um_filter_42_11]|uniref:Uncharacterized protein n=1 Tax=Candidatus Magasanikbacteria bacterium CG_4_9_14_0_2_um_filter_42_11 TaxID=1974643 RepID=A0A2M8F8L9_9BACT|nr:MAG: hypothetical protein COY70_03125 [Candidatus Magasanikbacteria bacterium CG_4_10_14_0_8_um_filter_42_12]PJC52048.1 MAG: hypothetical protein CO030_04770 [Candidatus Magasanikbacteria bacterium CG_4_9_14_0_2_um_filter_42_11]